MGTIKVLSPKDSLIDTVVEELLKSGEKDFSNCVVMFPGKRPAHFVRKSLSEKVGSSYFPPRIFSIDLFIESLAREQLGLKCKQIEALDAVSILYDIHIDAESKIGQSHYISLDNFLPVGMKLFEELEEVALANLSLRTVKDALSAVEFPKFHSLGYYYERFYAEISTCNLLTRAMLYREAAKRIKDVAIECYTKIILAGFYAFTGAEREIFRELLKRENVTAYFQDGKGIESQLDKLGIRVKYEDMPETLPQIHLYKSPDLHGQVLGLATKLKDKIDSGKKPDQSNVIVLPVSASLFPVVRFPLSLLREEEYNIALGYPLVRTPAFSFINSLMNLVLSRFDGKFSSEKYINFVLHPYTKNIRLNGRSDVTRILFHAIEEYFAERGALSLISLDEIEQDEKLFEKIKMELDGIGESYTVNDLKAHLVSIHENTIKKLCQFDSIGAFIHRVIEVLDYIFVSSTANLHPLFRPFAEQFMEVLHQISLSILSEKKFETTEIYFIFLRNFLQSQEVPFTGTPLRGLQVLGLLETRNLKFETLYMLDVNDDVIPGSKGEDMLLPQQIRQKLGLETYHERELLKEYYFNLAVNSANEVHLFYVENPEDGKKEKSRLVQKLLWDFQKKDESKQKPEERVKTHRFENPIKYHVNLTNRSPLEISKTPDMIELLKKKNSYSVRQLDTYLRCQLKFYYMSVLRLEEKSEVADEFDMMDVGVIVHEILREYFSQFLNKTIEPKRLSRAEIEKVVEKNFEQKFGTSMLGSTLLLKKQVKFRLGDFIEKYQSPIAESMPIKLLDLETSIRIEKNGYRFAGRIDRIEQRGKEIFIIDYKTGKDDKYVKIDLEKLDVGDRSTWNDAIGSLQLPMYMLLYGTQTNTPIDNIIPAYLFFGGNQIDETIEVSIDQKGDTPKTIFEKIEEIIFKIVDEICNIIVPFTPPKSLEKECSRCSYNNICNTTWIMNKKGI